MSFIERYNNGETVEVYQDIYNLGENAFNAAYLNDVTEVLNETFRRVKFNLGIIHKALLDMDYKLRTEFSYHSQAPLTEPLKNCEKMLKKLDKTVKPFGYVPLSLKTFYRIVGSCNFTWDYENYEELHWEYADPLEIIALDDIFDEEWQEMMEEMREEEGEESPVYLDFSGDYYHKDNVSGGAPYAIEITEKPSIDSRVLFDDVETTFINYLRLSFDNCGFMKITYPEHNNDYEAFFNLVKPQLKKI